MTLTHCEQLGATSVPSIQTNELAVDAKSARRVALGPLWGLQPCPRMLHPGLPGVGFKPAVLTFRSRLLNDEMEIYPEIDSWYAHNRGLLSLSAFSVISAFLFGFKS